MTRRHAVPAAAPVGSADAPMLAHRTMATPIGPLELVAGPAGLRAVLWPGEDGSRVRRAVGAERGSGAGTRNDPTSGAGRGSVDDRPDDGASAAGTGSQDRARATAHLDQAVRELAEYFEGTRRTFDVALDADGTPFQRSAWEVLRTIPYGATMSYGAQAAALGDPNRARAVGAANGRNPISIIVPCHRVVASSGALTGFAGGLGTKQWLLAHEQKVLAQD